MKLALKLIGRGSSLNRLHWRLQCAACASEYPPTQCHGFTPPAPALQSVEFLERTGNDQIHQSKLSSVLHPVALLIMPFHAATHPLIAHKMTRLRDKKTSTGDFRRILKEMTFYLGFEATRDIQVKTEVITTPMNMEFQGTHVKDKIAIIPILRAGLGMAEGMLELIPQASVHHIGKN